MRLVGYRFQLLDSALFWRKILMLIVFFGLFVVLKIYQESLLLWYGVFLLLLHMYILGVFLWRVRWRALAADRRSFAVRVIAILTFVLLLTMIKGGAALRELTLFVALSGTVHVLLLLTLTVEARPATIVAAESES